MDHTEMRKVFNSSVKPEFQRTHTPQCAKCKAFHPWGDGEMIVHHKKMLIDGGTNESDNLIVLCKDCHDEWHDRLDENDCLFEEWLQKPPVRYYGAWFLAKDPIIRNNFGTILEDQWWRIQEDRMISQPYKDEQCRKYVDQYSSNWIDW